MAIHSDIRDQAYQFFIEEAPELLQVLEAGILSLSQDHSTAKIHQLMRAAHTLKGGAASVGLEPIAALSHRLETILQALYGDTFTHYPNLENQLLQVYDCLRSPLLEQLNTGSFDVDRALATAEPLFAQLEAQLGDALQKGESYIPSSAELGVDMVAEMMTVDVAQGLQALATIVAQPQNYDVAGELQAHVEVFAGLAELFNLTGFGTIAEATQNALAVAPHQALAIAQLALTDFERSRQALLAGDRSPTIGPSEALIAFTEAAPAGFMSTAAPFVPADPLTVEPVIADLTANGSFSLLEDVFGLATPPKTERHDAPSAVDVFDHEPTGANTHVDFDQPPLDDAELLRAGSLVPVPSFHDALQLGEAALAPDQPQTLHPRSPATRDASTPAAANLTVRVDSERLEEMSNLIGELAINRDSLALQNEQLQRVQRELLERFTRFQARVDRLWKSSDQLLVAQETQGDSRSHNGSHSGSHSGAFTNEGFAPPAFGFPDYQNSPSLLTADFDSLEMDRYGALHEQLQSMMEDMVQLEEAVDDITLLTKQSNQTLEEQRLILTPLRDEVFRARMLPLGEVLNRFPRVLRDLAAAYQKPIQLKLTGTDLLVDRAILEKLYDPLLHLLRNAFDHGIEAPNLRSQQGKPEQGKIEIRAHRKGNQTIVEVKDDGQGLNLEKIRSRVFELGWLSATQLSTLPTEALVAFIFEPGFSTAQQISELSGRGMGLDVVRSQLRSIKGRVTVKSSPQDGTTFTLYLPVTLTIAKLLLVTVDSAAVALAVDSIEEIVTPAADAVKQLGKQRFLNWQEQIIPVYRLADRLEYACPLPEAPSSLLLASAIAQPEHWAQPLLILRQEQQWFALEVDRLIAEQELVIKPFGGAIASPSYIYGCTVLGDGSLIPVIDGATLISLGLGQVGTEPSQGVRAQGVREVMRSIPQPPMAVQTVQSPTILVVDDAVTLRRTLALSLERAGFRVLQARDGEEAITQLQQRPSVQLVICDIEMPNMNGFEFLNYRRQDPQLASIPIVMLTSRSNDKHRWLATQLGATAYFTKPYLEQELLATLETLLHQS